MNIDVSKIVTDKLAQLDADGVIQLKIEETALTKVQKDLADMDKTEREYSAIGQLLHKIDVSISQSQLLSYLP